jgi:hypothetical protein
VEKSAQSQEAENHQAKPKIYQGSEVKLVSVMPGGFRQVGIEGEIQAIAKYNGNQVFDPFHRYGFHLHFPAWASASLKKQGEYVGRKKFHLHLPA